MRQIAVLTGLVLASLLVFQTKVGFQKVATDNDEWLLIRTTDRLPDYLAFRYFHRVELEDLPDTLNYSYPQRVSPIYTNVTPLISYPLKWMGIGDTEKFQIYGVWFLSCFLLQGFIALLFFKAIGIKDQISLFLGTCFFVLSVPMLFRLDHPTLVHHWTVIAAMVPFFTHWKSRITLPWFVGLAIISATTHPYMLPFGSAFPVLYALHQWLRKGQMNVWDLMTPVLSIGVSLLLLWKMGAFGFDVSAAAGEGFGYYSANLNTFYNNFGLTNAPFEFDTYHYGAYEGLAYLGMGVLILLIINLIAYRKKRQKLKTLFSRKWLALTVGIGAFTFFAFSDVWTFHEMILVSWPDDWGEKYFGIFRSSGRYIWPAFYLLMGLTIYGWTRLPFRKAFIQLGLLIALSIQLWDVFPLLTDRIPENSGIEQFENENWEEVFSKFDLIITYPPYQRTLYKNDDASHLIYIASKNAQPITAGHLPRPDIPSQFAFQKELDDLLNGDHNEDLVKEYRKALIISTMGYLPIFQKAIDRGYLQTWQKGNYMLLANPDFVSDSLNLDSYWADFDDDQVVELSTWMRDHDQGHLVIIGQDESTSHPGNEFLSWMEDRNSEFRKVAFRDAYFGWFQDGRLKREKWDRKEVNDTLNIKGDEWIVHSEGNLAGNNSYLMINGSEVGEMQRGLNIFHIEEGSDTITIAQFDTYKTSALQKEVKIILNSHQN